MSNDVFGGHELAIPYRPVAELLEAYADRDPDKVAIVDLDQDTKITFGDLYRRVNDIAVHLKALGIGKGDKVLLLSDECLEKLVLWLGIWRIGAVCCPLNIEMNFEHLTELSTIVAPKLALYHVGVDCSGIAQLCQCIPFVTAKPEERGNPPAGEFFGSVEEGARADASLLPERNDPRDISCIFCTSGTTSRPKVVVYDHAAYWLCGLSTIDMLGLTEDDRTLEYRSFGWNSAQILSFMPFLQRGLTMHIARRFSRSRFFEWIKANEITFSAGIPTVVNMLLNKPMGISAEDVPSLKRMTCSTAPLSPEQWTKFETMYGVQLLQLYGMSEAGWICGNRHYQFKLGTVGPPALHQEFEIVDGDGKRCPPGVEGEVSIGGPQTALGTMNDDGTLEPVRSVRIKTGDLAVMDENGFVTVTGRTKDLIIRGGMNISPVEIDAVIMSNPDVLEGACIGAPDPIYGEEVVAFVVPKSDGLTEDQVIEHCRTQLPNAKVPKRVYFVEQLPRSDRGKVLRGELRELLPS